MRLGFFEAEGWEKEILERELDQLSIVFTTARLTEENVESFKDLDIISVFIRSSVDRKLIDSLPNLKLIVTRSTGYDHIDITYAKEKGILVCNVPEYCTRSVAEWTIALMINLMRKTYHAIDRVKETGIFDISDLRGEELFGKTLGVIGTGRIGKEVIKLAKALGMRVIAYDIKPDSNFEREYEIRYTSLEGLLGSSDVITIHVDLNPSTYHLINLENVKLIKPGAYLINTSRGSVIDTQALLYALEKGILRGVALDVLEEEKEMTQPLGFSLQKEAPVEKLRRLLANHILIRMPNVLITPHNAFNSQEAVKRSLKTTIDNIRAFLKGAPVNVVNL